MNKSIIYATVVGLALATPAFAEPAKTKESILPKVDLSFVTDSTYNTTQETGATEFGIVTGFKGLELSLLPSYDWDNSKISDIEIAAGYTVNITDKFSVTPYGEVHFDNDLDDGDKIIGLKTNLKF